MDGAVGQFGVVFVDEVFPDLPPVSDLPIRETLSVY